MAAQHVDHVQSTSVATSRKDLIRAITQLHPQSEHLAVVESVICPSSQGSHRSTIPLSLILLIGDPSAVSRRAGDELCHREPCSAVFQVHETGPWSCESRVDDTDDVDQYDNGPTKHFTDRGKDSLSDARGPNTLAASGPLVEESQPSLAGCRSIQPDRDYHV